MGKLLCEKNVRDAWCRNESVRAEIGPILQTHTHTRTHARARARVSYSSIDLPSEYISVCFHNSFLVAGCVFNHLIQSGKCRGVILAHRLVD